MYLCHAMKTVKNHSNNNNNKNENKKKKNNENSRYKFNPLSRYLHLKDLFLSSKRIGFREELTKYV